MQNGNNLNFSSFDALDNPVLSCIQVDDPPGPLYQLVLFADLTASFNAFVLLR